ncbi:MAG: hypothetical protein AB7V13_10345 [Pseudorhodoplanes sp.]|uniref:hypothetical protein n=1 Tax=Pseudorhodoplanes sp. TaxID=1934341 RepID=UPI003D140499
MIRTLVAMSIAIGFVLPVHAQQNRAKLDAPGKVAFGTSFEQAQKLLGADAEVYEIDPPQRGMKALLCDKCAPLPNVEGLTLWFRDKDGLIRIEAFAIAGMFKTVDACQKSDTDMLPKLIEQFGKPDANRNAKQGDESTRTATFRFADGSAIEHVSSISGDEIPCTFTVSYKSKASR